MYGGCVEGSKDQSTQGHHQSSSSFGDLVDQKRNHRIRPSVLKDFEKDFLNAKLEGNHILL